MRLTYSFQQLLTFRTPDLRPTRPLRKVLFNARIWCPTVDRRKRGDLNESDFIAIPPMTGPTNPTGLEPPNPSPTSPVPAVKETHGLRVATWNSRSLTEKFAYVAHVLLERQLDVLAITESWHHGSDDVPLRRAAAPGYTIQDRPRDLGADGQEVRGGGIAIYARSSLRASPIHLDMEITTFEALCTTLSTSHGSTTLLAVYRPSSTSLTGKFFEEFSSVLESLITRNSQLIILGDFNIHVEDSSDADSLRFLELLKQFGLCQHVSEATHDLGGTLDLAITADDVPVQDLIVHPRVLSDHSLVELVLPPLHTQPIHAIRMVRGWKSLDYEALGREIRRSKLNLDQPSLDQLSVTDLFDLYTNTLSKLLNNLLPLRKVKMRIRPLAAWFDGECRKLRRCTRCLERRYRRSKEPADRLTWIIQLRALHRLYRSKEAEYWENLVSRDEKNPRRLWSTISGLLGRAPHSSPTPSFTANDFLKMVTDKIAGLRAATADAPPPEFIQTDCKFQGFRPVLEADLRRVLSSSNLKSCELDPLPPFVIANVLDDIICFLVYTFNRSLTEGYIPASQKRAIILPRLKNPKLDLNACQNYRPISNLSYLSKTLERLVAAQLVPYLEQSGLLPPAQSGFRGHHSTETLLLSLLSEIYTAIDKSQLSLLALFDVSSAFDMVDHELLLQRLHLSFGLTDIPLKWFKSYLTDRTQMVVVGSSRSPWVRVSLGVPQGSVLGPILYLLFTADIPSVLARHQAKGHLYADDVQTLVHGSPSEQTSLVERTCMLLHDLHHWMSANRLNLNPTKTKLIWFGTRQQLQKIDLKLLTSLTLTSLFPPVFVTWVSH